MTALGRLEHAVGRHRQLVWLALVIAPLMLQARLLMSGFPGASGDDFFHALLVYEWSQHPYAATSAFGLSSIHWLPAHTWIGGAVYTIAGHLVPSLRAVSLVAVVIELTAFGCLATHLFDRRVGILSLLLVGFLPWQVWLSASMTEMTLHYAIVVVAFLFFVRWLDRAAPRDMLAASVAFLLGTFVRVEGWLFASLFSACLVVLLIRRHGAIGAVATTAAIATPWLFMVIWLVYNFATFSQPFYFLQSNRAHMAEFLEFGRAKWLVSVLQYPFLMLTVSPLLFLMTLFGLVACRWRLSPTQRVYLVVVLGELVALVVASLSGLGTKAAPQRYVLLNVILLSPFAAYWLSRIWLRRHGPLVVVALVVAHVGTCSVKTLFYREDFSDVVEGGRHLKEEFEAGRLTASDTICTETCFRLLADQLVESDKDFLIVTSEDAALEVYSGHPRNMVFNILQIKMTDLIRDNRSQSAGDDQADKSKVAGRLAERGVTRLVLRDRELMELVPATFHLDRMFGEYALFSNGARPEAIPAETTIASSRLAALDEALGDDLRLRGYRFKGGMFPRSLAVLWESGRRVLRDEGIGIRVTFTHQGDPQTSFARVVAPVFRWYTPTDKLERAVILDELSLALPAGMPSGEYTIALSLVERGTPWSPEVSGAAHAVTLPAVTLVSSKREALRDMLTLRQFDWTLAMKILMIV